MSGLGNGHWYVDKSTFWDYYQEDLEAGGGEKKMRRSRSMEACFKLKSATMKTSQDVPSCARSRIDSSSGLSTADSPPGWSSNDCHSIGGAESSSPAAAWNRRHGISMVAEQQDSPPPDNELLPAPSGTTAFLRNLPDRFKEEHVAALLNEVGLHYDFINMPRRHRFRGQSRKECNRGYAFVWMDSVVAVERCIHLLNGAKIYESSAKRIVVQFARTERPDHVVQSVPSNSFADAGRDIHPSIDDPHSVLDRVASPFEQSVQMIQGLAPNSETWNIADPQFEPQEPRLRKQQIVSL